MAITWIKVKAGTKLRGLHPINKNQQVEISQDCRMAMDTIGGEKGVYFLNDGYLTYAWKIDKDTQYEKITIPAMSREFAAMAVKGSVWEFERDWTFQGYDAAPNVYTIKAGTEIKLASSKMQFRGCNFAIEEKFLEIEPNAAFNMFRGEYLPPGRFVPAKEASQYLKLVTPGKIRTYWRMEQDDGTQHVKKNFATLSALKASVRVRFNLHKPLDNDAYAPEWIDNDSGWMKRPDHQKGVWAVQYDFATKMELAREDIIGMVIAAALSV